MMAALRTKQTVAGVLGCVGFVVAPSLVLGFILNGFDDPEHHSKS
jgi:hypothetical protein